MLSVWRRLPQRPRRISQHLLSHRQEKPPVYLVSRRDKERPSQMKKVNLFPMGVYRVDPDHEQIFEYIAQEPIKMLGLYAVIKEQREALVSDLQLKEFWVGREKVNPWEGTPTGDPAAVSVGGAPALAGRAQRAALLSGAPEAPYPYRPTHPRLCILGLLYAGRRRALLPG